MSRSADRQRLALPAGFAAAATVATLLAGVAGAMPAWADPARPGPVSDLTTPTSDLYTGIASLDGTVTVERTRKGAKARIDATVLFGKDSAVLRPGARARIRQVAAEFTWSAGRGDSPRAARRATTSLAMISIERRTPSRRSLLTPTVC